MKVHEYHYVAIYMNDYNFETKWGMNMIYAPVYSIK